MTKYAIAPVNVTHEDGGVYIIAGKKYPLLSYKELELQWVAAFDIRDEDGDVITCLQSGCSFLEDFTTEDWVIIEED